MYGINCNNKKILCIVTNEIINLFKFDLLKFAYNIVTK